LDVDGVRNTVGFFATYVVNAVTLDVALKRLRSTVEIAVRENKLSAVNKHLKPCCRVVGVWNNDERPSPKGMSLYRISRGEFIIAVVRAFSLRFTRGRSIIALNLEDPE